MQKQISDLIKFQRSSRASVSPQAPHARGGDDERRRSGGDLGADCDVSAKLSQKELQLDFFIALNLTGFCRRSVQLLQLGALRKMAYGGVVRRLTADVETLSGEVLQLGAQLHAPAVPKDLSHTTTLCGSNRESAFMSGRRRASSTSLVGFSDENDEHDRQKFIQGNKRKPQSDAKYKMQLTGHQSQPVHASGNEPLKERRMPNSASKAGNLHRNSSTSSFRPSRAGNVSTSNGAGATLRSGGTSRALRM